MILFQFIVVKINNQVKLYLSSIPRLKTINLFRPIFMSWASELFVAIKSRIKIKFSAGK